MDVAEGREYLEDLRLLPDPPCEDVRPPPPLEVEEAAESLPLLLLPLVLRFSWYLVL